MLNFLFGLVVGAVVGAIFREWFLTKIKSLGEYLDKKIGG